MSTTTDENKNQQGYYYLKYTVDMFRQGFNFNGRTCRTEYWIQILEYLSVMLGVALFVGLIILMMPDDSRYLGFVIFLILFVIIGLITFIPRLAMMVRRNHDFDISGWWILFCLIPYAGNIVIIVFGCMPGTPGPNRFGPAPGSDHLSTTHIEPEEVVNEPFIEKV